MISKFQQYIYHFLRKTEKYTKTDMVYFMQNGFWLTFGRIVSAGSGLLLAIAFANLVPKEVFGTYKYILSIIGLLGISTLVGLNIAITHAVARGFEGSFISILKIKIKWGMIGGIVSLLLSAYYYINHQLDLSTIFFLIAFFIPFMDSLNVYDAFLEGKKLFKKITIYNSIIQIISVTIMIVVLLVTQNIFLLILAYIFSYTIMRFIFFNMIIKKYKPNNKKDPNTLSYGKHLSVMRMVAVASGHLDKILMWHFLGPMQLALYAFALAPVAQINSFLKSVTILSFPKFASTDKETIKKTLPIKTIKFFLLLVGIVICYITLAPFFYKLVFPQYLDSIIYSQFFAISLLFFPQRMLGQAIIIHGKKEILYILSIVGPAVKIILLFILLPLYGITGAILALIIPNILDFFMLSYFFKKM